jgi:hypothetical protein
MFRLVFISSLLFGGRPLPLVQAFSSSPLSLPHKVDPNKIIRRTIFHPSFAELVATPSWILYAVPANDDNGDDDDDEDEDEALLDDTALGDWRKFRASLIDAGLPTISSPSASSDASDSAISSSSPTTEETTQQQPKTAAAAASAETRRRKSVAAQNEALLEQQSQALAQEYRTGVWAHIIEEPEVGGLLCRMPLEAELYHGSTTSTSSSTSSSSSVSSSSSTTGSDEGSYWKDKLRLMVSLENDKGNITTATSALLAASSSKQQLDDNDSDEAATAAKVKQ